MRIIRGGLLVLALLLGLAGVAQARGSVPIVNLEGNPATGAGGKELALEAIAEAIRAAGKSQGYPWEASNETPGAMQLTTLVRNKHTVVVDVTFDTKTYNIRYASSINMNYEKKKKDGKEVIHPNYNVWVQQLKAAIDAELAKR